MWGQVVLVFVLGAVYFIIDYLRGVRIWQMVGRKRKKLLNEKEEKIKNERRLKMVEEILQNDDKGEIDIKNPIISIKEIQEIKQVNVTEQIRHPHEHSEKVPHGLFGFD